MEEVLEWAFVGSCRRGGFDRAVWCCSDFLGGWVGGGDVFVVGGCCRGSGVLPNGGSSQVGVYCFL